MAQKIQHQSLRIQILKKIITPQLLFSVSVFSLFFAQSSWLSSSRNSFNFYFSNFRNFHYLLRHTIDKNCMFLLWNGLLVFVAKYSGLTTSFSGNSSEEFSTLEKRSAPVFENEVLLQSSGSASTDKAMENGKENEKWNIGDVETENENLILEKEAEEEKRESGFVTEEEEERRMIVAHHYEKESDMSDRVFDFMEEREEEEEEEEGHGMMMSNEDLKRKFDDFIRRIKEEIRVEAQQQLIVVK